MEFLKDGVILLFTSAGILLGFFPRSVRGSEAQGHFWQDACRWWICKVRFTDRCRDWTCQHKVNGRDSLTAHQSLGKIPKMLHIKRILGLLLIRSQSEMIIINSVRLCGFLGGYHGKQRVWSMRWDRHCDIIPKCDGCWRPFPGSSVQG